MVINQATRFYNVGIVYFHAIINKFKFAIWKVVYYPRSDKRKVHFYLISIVIHKLLYDHRSLPTNYCTITAASYGDSEYHEIPLNFARIVI